MQKLFSLVLGLLVFFQAYAQNYTMDGSPVSACQGSFFDPGGPNGNYTNNLNLSTTICSGNTGSGTHIRLDFSGVSLAPGDVICFYDGSDITAPLLSCSDQYTPGVPFVVQATAANPGGCLTVVFTSNSSGIDAGWSASISCVASCQQVLADLISTNPVSIPADTGWIDICPGERVTFLGQGVYPQNGYAYAQTDFSTEFEWNFGDGNIAYGPLVSHVFTEPGGYYVQLFLKDTLGCGSTNLINQRIRVAPKPVFTLANTYANPICAGDTLSLSAIVNSAAATENLGVGPGLGSFAVDGSRADSLALPDGTGVPYQTSLYFTEFSPGQTLTNINDLEAILINIEHSWARDIEIKLSCPNGQQVILHNHPGNVGSEIFLGLPNDTDDFFPVPGTGWDYQWTPNATNPTWLAYANSILPGGGTLPPGDYSSFDPLTNLLGCPLNGEWTLTVTDFWGVDNGYIFNWGINFNDLLYPFIETFQQNLLHWEWKSHPSIFNATSEMIAVSPPNAGIAAYTFTVTDDFGCIWDSTLQVTVLPFTHPNCFSCTNNYSLLTDTTVCNGEPVQLDGSRIGGGIDTVLFESYPDYRLGNRNHPHPMPYNAPIAVNSTGYNILTNPIAQINSVCVDLETDFDADIYLYLRSPDNKILELSTGNGGSGDNYKTTCFSPTATNAITTGTAPFNGAYLPEGTWSSLNNAQVNGNWTLLVSDGFGINQYGKLKWWSMGFNITNPVSYSWTNSTSLTCNNCPNPVANPTQNTAYIVTAIDAFNCTHKDTVNITVQNFFPAPSGLTMTNMSGGSITWEWLPLNGVSEYEVQINNGPWIVVGATVYTVSGLVPGDMVDISVRALSTAVACPPEETSATQVYAICTLSATLNATFPCSCPDAANGACDITASGAQGPFAYYSSYGPSTPYTNGNLTFFPAGNHFVYVVDSIGCRDTSFFAITAPSAFSISPAAADVACFGGSTGQLSVIASGGTGVLTYTWQRCAGGPTYSGTPVNNLTAGCYQVTVSDQSGCTSTAIQQINENPQLVLGIVQDSVSCFGLADGSATVSVSGGLFPYSYLWTGGSTTNIANNRPAGLHSVTITDAAGCMATTLISIRQPAQILVDSIIAAPTSCKGLNNGLIAVYPSGGTLPYTFAWTGTGQVAPTIINLSEGTYTVTITDKNGCSTMAQASVFSPAAFSMILVSTAAEQCAGSCDGAATIQLSGGVQPYSTNWNVATVPPNSLFASNLCPGNINIVALDANNCSIDTTISIAAAPEIIIQFSPTDPSCPANQDGAITTQISGGTQPLAFLWSNNQTTADATGLTCATYTLTVTDGNDCSVSATAILDCPDALTISGILTNQVSCNGASDGNATVTISGGSAPYTYGWSDPNQQNTPTATGLPAGVYTVTVADNNGCSAVEAATIEAPNALVINASTSPVFCLGSSDGTAQATTIGGTSPYTYLWSNNETSDVITGLAAGFYNVTVTDANNCTASAPPVEVLSPLSSVIVAAVQTKVACFESSTGIASASASGGVGNTYQYVWSNNAVSNIADNLSIGQYTVTASDANGCTATASVTISQHDSITVNIATLPPTCFGYTNGQAALNLVKGGAGMGILSNYFLQWGGLPGAPTGDYWGQIPADTPVSLTVTDQEGCSRVFEFELKAPSAVKPVIQSANVTCAGSDNGSATVVSALGDHPVLVYIWSNGANMATATALSAGIFTVTITDTKGCSGTGTATITAPDPLQLDFITSTSKCLNDSSGTIEALARGGTSPYLFTWSNGDQTPSIDGLMPGVYQLTLTDGNNCTLVDSASIINPDPTILLLASDDAICYGTPTGRLDISLINGTAPFFYSINNEPFTGSSVFLSLYSGNYRVEVKDGNGCLLSGNTFIGQPDPISVNISPMELAVVYGDSVVLTAMAANGVGPYTYTWDSDIIENLNCSDSISCVSIGFIPQIENRFRVVAKDANGCRGFATAHILVEKPRDIYVPTGFTPNADNNNDLLHIFGKTKQVEKVKVFRVYDRWGELVYEDRDIPVNDTTRGWDGTFKGADCQPDVYIWVMEVLYRDGYSDELHGETTLIR